MSVSTYIGTLYEHLSDVAWRIQHLPAMVSIVVWTDDRGNVYASEAASSPPIEPEAFIGNYCPTRTIDQIEEDLHAVLRERSAKRSRTLIGQCGPAPEDGTKVAGSGYMSEPFMRISFVRDELHQLQAVIAHCVKCHEERSPIVTPMAWGAVRVRCPICQSASVLIVAEHDESPNAWS
jgi:hypothetical protein